MFDELKDDIIGVMLLRICRYNMQLRKLLNPNEDKEVLKTYMDYVLNKLFI